MACKASKHPAVEASAVGAARQQPVGFVAEEFMSHLMPIIESVRAQQSTPVAYPLKVNTSRPTAAVGHVCNAPQHHWVYFFYLTS